MPRHKREFVRALLFVVLSLGAMGFSQTTVTTSGGTPNFVPKFDGSSNIVSSQIVENSGNVGIGTTGSNSGAVSSAGNLAAFYFQKRALTSFPATPHAGDQFAWYNPDGSARLWTYDLDDLLIIGRDGNARLGRIGWDGGFLNLVGKQSGVAFTRRSLADPAAAANAGDIFAWYNPDGTARLYTSQNGDVLTVQSNGQLN